MQKVFGFEFKLKTSKIGSSPQDPHKLGKTGNICRKRYTVHMTYIQWTAIDSRLSSQWRICVYVLVFIECSIAMYL